MSWRVREAMIVRMIVLLLLTLAVWAQQPAGAVKPAASVQQQASPAPKTPAAAAQQPAVPPKAQASPASPQQAPPAAAQGQAAAPPKPQASPASPQQAPAAPAQAAPQVQTPALPKTQPAAAPAAEAGFELNLQNASLQQVIDILARRLRINYILDPRVKGSVTLNTYGEIKQVNTRALLETVLRINGAAIVQVGDIYRIVPVADVARLPISPQNDAKTFPEDEREMLNLVFLKYVTVSELSKLIEPFIGEGGKIISYEPANLLLILDNARSMKRTMDLISIFDNDTLASQRVRLFEVKNGRPSDLARELETVMKAVSLSGDKGNASVRFLPIDRINTIVAIAPNPGVFSQVEEWLKRLDIEPKVTAGTMDNYVYRVKYGWAEALAMSIMQLYMGYGYGGMGMGGYGMMGMGGYGGMGMGGYGGMGMGGYGGGIGMGGYGGMGGGYGGMGVGLGGYGMGGYGGMGMGGYGGGMYPGMGGMGYSPYSSPIVTPGMVGSQTPATAGGMGTQGTAGGTDLTGNYLGSGGSAGMQAALKIPRVIPNPFDNTLLIQATPQDYQQVLKLLQQLDVPPRQVLIEAKIFEVNMQGDFSSGVQAFLTRQGAAVPAGFPSTRQLQAALVPPTTTLTAGILVGASRQLLGILTLTEQNKRAKLVSAPTLIATDSIPAKLNVGDSVPTLTGQAVGSIQQGGNSLFNQAINNVQTGVTLNVVARVTPSGIITMKIDQDVSAPIAPDKSAAIQTPSFSRRTMSTQVTVQDGDTIAIGGIILDTDTLTSSGMPLLHRIPGIGAAFGSKNVSKTRTELVVFFTPRVIYDTNQITEASDELKSKFKKLRPLLQE